MNLKYDDLKIIKVKNVLIYEYVFYASFCMFESSTII